MKNGNGERRIVGRVAAKSKGRRQKPKRKTADRGEERGEFRVAGCGRRTELGLALVLALCRRLRVGDCGLEGEPVVASDAGFVDYLALEPDADIAAFVKWNRNDLAGFEVDHPLMPPSGIRPVKAESGQPADYLAGFERDQPRSPAEKS